MKRHLTWANFFKLAILLIWLLSLGLLYEYMDERGIDFRHLLPFIRHQLQLAGPWGPVLLVSFYFVSVLIPFPLSGVAVLSGALYGAFWGTVFVLLGLNLASTSCFWLARFFGRRFVALHEPSWLKRYEHVLEEEGFLTVLFMRLFFFPFDVVSIVAGLSDISFRQYFLATALGSFPHAIAAVVLGRSLTHPRTLIVSALLSIIAAGVALQLRRTPWVRRRLYRKTGPSIFEK